MQRVTSGIGVLSMLLLSGCQISESDNPEPLSLTALAVEKHYIEPNCQGENCSEVTVSALAFPQSADLTAQLQARLLTLAMGITEGGEPPAESWDGYASSFFDLAKEDSRVLPDFMASEALLKAEVYAHHDDLLIVELNTYVYHAGQAHGLPMTEFMVIDERLQRVVTDDDMLLDGKQEAFQAVLSQAHQHWMDEMAHDAQFEITWPLSDKRNIAPLETGWELKYNVYDIAPYAVGQPTLTLTFDELEGIAKPRYLGR